MAKEFHAYRLVKTNDVALFPYNSRTHSTKQIDQIAKSIRTFGFTNPILIDENNNLIAGEGRILAAKKLKMTEVPSIVVKDLTDEKKRALVIADNKLALNSGWDDDLLRSELQFISDSDMDIDVIGFDEDELNVIFDLEEEPEKKSKKDHEDSNAFLLAIETDTESEQEQIFQELTERGFKCKIMN